MTNLLGGNSLQCFFFNFLFLTELLVPLNGGRCRLGIVETGKTVYKSIIHHIFSICLLLYSEVVSLNKFDCNHLSCQVLISG